MIRSFACADTEALFHSRQVSRFRNIERVARRQLLRIHAATELASLRIPPGNPLEALRADREGQHGIRIIDPRRLRFVRFWPNLQAEYDIRVADKQWRARLSPGIRAFQPAAG